jgi:hypothetical protein
MPLSALSSAAQAECVFPLAPEDAALLRRGDGAHELQVLCVRLDDSVARLHWPCHASLSVNGTPVPVPCRTAAADLGRAGRDPPGVVPAAVYAGTAPNVPITLRLVLAGYDTRPFAVLARVARRRALADVAAEVPPAAAFAADLVRARGVASGDEDVQTTSVSLSLRCPLGGGRVAVPVRYAACRGLAVFDLNTFLAVSGRSRNWQCPLCAACGPPSALRRDAFVATLLAALATSSGIGAFDDVADVEVNRDGAWRPRFPSGAFGRWYSPEETQRAAAPGGAPLDAAGGEAAGGAGGGSGAGAHAAVTEDLDVIVISDSEEEEEAPPPKRQHTMAPAPAAPLPMGLPLPRAEVSALALAASMPPLRVPMPRARAQGTSPPPAPETQPQEEAAPPPQAHQQQPASSLLRVRLALPPEARLMPRLLPSSLQQPQQTPPAPPPPSSSSLLPFGLQAAPPAPRQQQLLSMPSLDPLAQLQQPRVAAAPPPPPPHLAATTSASLDDAAARLARDMFALGGAGASFADAFLREDASEGGWRPRHAHAPPRAPAPPAAIEVVEIDDSDD